MKTRKKLFYSLLYWFIILRMLNVFTFDLKLITEPLKWIFAALITYLLFLFLSYYSYKIYKHIKNYYEEKKRFN